VFPFGQQTPEVRLHWRSPLAIDELGARKAIHDRIEPLSSLVLTLPFARTVLLCAGFPRFTELMDAQLE
jgi:hypothetical protein